MTYRTFVVRRLTCGLCGAVQRVRSAEGEGDPRCDRCGAASWLALPTLAAPDPGEFARGYVSDRRWDAPNTVGTMLFQIHYPLEHQTPERMEATNRLIEQIVEILGGCVRPGACEACRDDFRSAEDCNCSCHWEPGRYDPR